MAAEEQKNLCRGSEESAWSQGKTTTITSLLLVCFWELKNLVRVRRPSRTHYDVFIMTGLNLLQLRSNTKKNYFHTLDREVTLPLCPLDDRNLPNYFILYNQSSLS